MLGFSISIIIDSLALGALTLLYWNMFQLAYIFLAQKRALCLVFLPGEMDLWGLRTELDLLVELVDKPHKWKYIEKC